MATPSSPTLKASRRRATPAQNDNRYYPSRLKPISPRLNDRTYLPIEALPIEMHGLTVGCVWWNDDDMAANCEYVPFDMFEYKSFGPGPMV